jgi:hypothetical protein
LWIVAPITRAVDDKAAKTLLGNTFKRQLKYDGTYSAVTFICSKTDDISRTEATDSLELGDAMAELEDQMKDLRRKRRALEKNLKELKDKKKDHEAMVEQIDDELEAWDDRSNDFDEGKTVYPPSPKKRKRRSKQSSRKRRKSDSSDDDADYSDESSDEDSDADQDDGTKAPRTPLTREQIDNRIDELKSLKKEARRERSNLEDQIKTARKELKPIEDEESAIDAKMSALCIAGRNEYSRSAIQQDFAAGIKELDQENAEEEDPENFNPEEDLRDYDQVARDLPVFCVSSRAYQQLSGRLQKDNKVAGFEDVLQTEIPQLQAHCKKLTVNGRQASCRRFLNALAQLLTSLGLWSSEDGTGAKMTNQQRDHERNFLVRKLKELEKQLEKCVSGALEEVEATLDEQLFEKFPAAIKAAADDAIPTSSGWGAHHNAGGLYWATYKATVRRNGVFSGSRGPRDFNQELTEPIYKSLATTWEKAFQRRLPNILRSFTRDGTALLKKFHAAIAARCRERGHGLARIGMLENQLQAYQAIFGDLATGMIAQVNEGQRDINREFTPVIQGIMDPVYMQCTAESGPGQYNRMKGYMAQHVSQHRISMFEDAAKKVRSSIEGLCQKVRKVLDERTDSIYLSMQRDYMSIIGGVSVNTKMPREERAVRRQVDEAIGRTDQFFQEVLDADVEDLKEAVVSSEADGVVDVDGDVDMENEEKDEADDEINGSEAGEDSDANVDEDGNGIGLLKMRPMRPPLSPRNAIPSAGWMNPPKIDSRTS